MAPIRPEGEDWEEGSLTGLVVQPLPMCWKDNCVPETSAEPWPVGWTGLWEGTHVITVPLPDSETM